VNFFNRTAQTAFVMLMQSASSELATVVHQDILMQASKQATADKVTRAFDSVIKLASIICQAAVLRLPP